ncbi:YhcB family protein [Pseudidiomarina mangrovi]|uniref:YhcB family protein n=1 Tax=Pseudidiomarina mangrovi TaxID=2487133 RepID=UPI000FCACA6D|nr:YhcB family protein [Pseudidiomarina mangrovi]
MSWIIGILLVAVGAVVGFFVARYWFHEHSEQARLSEEVNQSKQQLADYQREVAEHFATATALVEQLEETQDKLKSYLNNSADILQRQQTQPTLPFFAEDTMRQLRMANTVSRDRKDAKKEEADAAPRDYSDQKSGLFSSTKD